MVFPTPELAAKINQERWTAQPETEAAMDYVFRRLTQPESDGMSMLERVYRTCPDFQTQRDEQIQTAAFAILREILKDKHCFFQADCPPDGRARFRLRIGDGQHELSKCVPAYREWSLNLLRDQADWVIPPKIKPAQKPAPPKTDSQTKAKSRLPAKGRQ